MEERLDFTLFKKFPKISRLNRNMVVTEKIDGTNAQIYIELRKNIPEFQLDRTKFAIGKFPYLEVTKDGTDYIMVAGSRNRYISKENDNFGFGRFVSDNRDELLELGTGRHYGEWWGKGIQRGYGLDEKRLSLFNVNRWNHPEITLPECVHVVPKLYQNTMDSSVINNIVDALKTYGSHAAPGFMRPEGVIVSHTASNGYFKVMCENDEIHKGKKRG